MLLTKLILENYGVYDGRHVLDLTCDENKPVILCGGKNGSGKTTILEAIMLSLYGKTFHLIKFIHMVKIAKNFLQFKLILCFTIIEKKYIMK